MDATHTAEEISSRTYAHMSSFLHFVPAIINADPAKLRLAHGLSYGVRHGWACRGGTEKGTGCVQSTTVSALGTVSTLKTLECPTIDVCVRVS